MNKQQKNKQRKKIKARNGYVQGFKILIFGAVLAAMSLIGLMWFLRPDTSALEKRTLTKFPAFTLSAFWDGSYFHEIDTWYADTYPLRESMISTYQTLQSHYGIRSRQIIGETMVADDIPDAAVSPAPSAASITTADVSPSPVPSPSPAPEDGTVNDVGEMIGNIYITDRCGYGLYYFSQSSADNYAATMNAIYDRIGNKVDLYAMVCPISAGIMLGDEVLEDMGSSDEGQAIDYMYAQLDPGIHAVAVTENLKAHNSEYIYFHTDHHWTQLGAYYAYQSFCQEKGVAPHDISQFEYNSYEGFIGTFYSSSNQSAELKNNPDTLETYTPYGTNDMTFTTTEGETYQWDIVYDATDYDSASKYMAFVGGDRPFSYAHNETITDGSAVMVVKDSYGNAFIPWLIDHYEYIYWVDYRYTWNTVSQMVEDYGVQDVIFECSIYTDSAMGYFNGIGQ